MDGAGYSACTSPATYNSLAQGSHSFDVRATDQVGNTGTPTCFTWTVDTTAPDTTIDTRPAAYTSSNSATFTFHASEGSTFACQLDGGAFSSCSSPQSYPGLAQGTHTFSVQATDTAGNTGSPASYSWAIDTTDPDTSITSGPENGSTTSSTSASFSFTGSDNISLPADLSFQCKLDGASFAPCTSPAAYTDLSAGSHTFSVKATDQAGNTDPTPDTRTWTIDTTAPDTTIDTTPSNPSNQTTAAFTFHSSEAGSTFECQLDTGGFASCTSPASYNSLTDGSHTFPVRASDAGGNTDQSPASLHVGRGHDRSGHGDRYGAAGVDHRHLGVLHVPFDRSRLVLPVQPGRRSLRLVHESGLLQQPDRWQPHLRRQGHRRSGQHRRFASQLHLGGGHGGATGSVDHE